MIIIEAIKRVLDEEKKPLSHSDIYKKIISNKYYKFGAKDPESVVRGKLRKHCFGINFPSASPKKLFKLSSKSTHKKPLYEIWDGSELSSYEEIPQPSESLPEEIIYNEHKLHRVNVKNNLLDYIKTTDPAFFERLVVDLIMKMGYGWDENNSGKVVGGPGDEGIDGIVSEDKLGLENIYIQAKQKNDNNVTPGEIRDFIGAMAIKGARKGIFFTPTDYSEQAKHHAEMAPYMEIKLINGEDLCELLIEHEMAVACVSTYKIFEVDKNYFSIE